MDGDGIRERACAASCVSRDAFPRRAAPVPHLHLLHLLAAFALLSKISPFNATPQRKNPSLSLAHLCLGLQEDAGRSFLARRMRSRRAYRFTINDFPEFAVNGDPPGTAAATVSERRFYPSGRSIRMPFPVCAFGLSVDGYRNRAARSKDRDSPRPSSRKSRYRSRGRSSD